jgi:hypothetical protein
MANIKMLYFFIYVHSFLIKYVFFNIPILCLFGGKTIQKTYYDKSESINTCIVGQTLIQVFELECVVCDRQVTSDEIMCGAVIDCKKTFGI